MIEIGDRVRLAHYCSIWRNKGDGSYLALTDSIGRCELKQGEKLRVSAVQDDGYLVLDVSHLKLDWSGDSVSLVSISDDLVIPPSALEKLGRVAE